MTIVIYHTLILHARSLSLSSQSFALLAVLGVNRGPESRRVSLRCSTLQLKEGLSAFQVAWLVDAVTFAANNKPTIPTALVITMPAYGGFMETLDEYMQSAL